MVSGCAELGTYGLGPGLQALGFYRLKNCCLVGSLCFGL